MWPFSTSTRSYQTIVSAKLAERHAKLVGAPEFSAAVHQEILEASATEIVRRIEKGVWTASQVLDAYIARAVQAQAKTNCLTEILFEEARATARQLDADFVVTKKLKGPLHGVPLSIKDQFDVAGVDSSVGFTRWANNPATEDAVVVHHLRAAGAIPFVKTNVPQTMLAFECSNPLWGRSLNPWSDAHTCGGSSGGEAALLAMDGSAAGIGSDIGGSLRIPAAYCGIYSLKPGYARTSLEGAKDPAAGFEAIKTSAGPMGRSVDDIELIARAIIGKRGSGYLPAPVPYRDVKIPSKLRFGYYITDGFVKASPACRRAVLETVKALQLEGHECLEIELPEPIRAIELFTGITSSDGYSKLTSHLGPDPQESSLFLVTLGPRLPGFVRSVAGCLIRTFMDPIFGSLVGHSRTKTVREFYDYAEEKNEFEKRWRCEVWGNHDIDAIIAPVQATPALPHGACNELSPLAAATILYNVVDSPVGIIPVTRVDPIQDQITEEWVIEPGHGSTVVEGMLYGKKIYDPVKMKGLPVSVQIVGQPWEEEKVIGMMHVVDKALGKRDFGPGSWQP
ncbi:amidase signature domain-containing protein [Amylostereum chailletii]|nr:amidase signature domain-containing protein [Amylostereum chailletii]